MKIAQYHRTQRPKHNIIFSKDAKDSYLYDVAWDRIYITTLFSFEWNKTADCINRAIKIAGGRKSIIFVGGISASLMTDQYQEIEEWKGIRFISGILNDEPAKSLKLGKNEFGGRTEGGQPIDELVPDYSILDMIDYKYPVNDAYFGYASRGCIRKCSFCGVPKLEGDQKVMPSITGMVQSIDALYGPRKDLVLMDNNVTAAPNFNEIIAEIKDLGFVPGAKLKRNGQSYKRRVDFNQGVDSRLLCKNSKLIQLLSEICIDPLRIAFDHWGVRKQYERSIREAAGLGIRSLSNYMLYNFHDTPEDLYRRLVLNIELNQELDVRIWSFPMRYQPVDLKERSHVGKSWTKYYLRSFQLILQASQGVVTGNPTFFNHAFGGSVENFITLLRLPHQFIFHRELFFKHEGRPILDEYYAAYNRLSENERLELQLVLDGPEGQRGLKPSQYIHAVTNPSLSRNVRDVMRFHAAYGTVTGNKPSAMFLHEDLIVPEEKKVEDAGLFDDSFASSPPLMTPPAFKDLGVKHESMDIIDALQIA